MSKIFVQYGCSGPDQGRILYCNLPVLLVRNHTSCSARLAFLFQPSNKNKVGAVSGEYTISCNLGLVRVHKVFHTNCDSNPKERSNCWDQFSQGGDRCVVVSMPYLAALDGARSRHDLCPRLILRDFYSEHTFTWHTHPPVSSNHSVRNGWRAVFPQLRGFLLVP